jgi:hypothetical protein
MELRIQLLSIAASIGILAIVFEAVRRRHLLERYALLWLTSGFVLLGLALWRGLLQVIADAIGVKYAPNALFVIAFGFILMLLFHFSLVVSRLVDQSKVLAQRVALLEERLREAERQQGRDEVLHS